MDHWALPVSSVPSAPEGTLEDVLSDGEGESRNSDPMSNGAKETSEFSNATTKNGDSNEPRLAARGSIREELISLPGSVEDGNDLLVEAVDAMKRGRSASNSDCGHDKAPRQFDGHQGIPSLGIVENGLVTPGKQSSGDVARHRPTFVEIARAQKANAAGWIEAETKVANAGDFSHERKTSSQGSSGHQTETFRQKVARSQRKIADKLGTISFRQMANRICRSVLNHKQLSRKGILLTEERRKMRAERDRRKRRDAHVRFRLTKRKTHEFSLLSHDSPFFKRWQMWMVVMMAYEVWAFPFRLALVDGSNATLMLCADAASDLAFVLDMGLRLCTKVPAGRYPQQDEELSGPKEIVGAYMRHVFPFEILPSLLYYVVTAFVLRHCDQGAKTRVGQRGYFKEMEKNLEVSVRALQGVKFSLIVFLSAHWVGCIFFWLARLNHLNDDTWVARFEELMPTFDKTKASLAKLYMVCLYRGFNSLANLGYDQEMPFTSTEILFSILVMAFQVYLSALVLGTLLNYLVAKDRMAEAHKKQLEQVARFAEAKRLPQDLRDKMFKYLQFQYEKNVQNKATVSMTLPKNLEMKVADAKYRGMIERCSARGCAFHQCDAHFLTAMLVKLRVLHVMPGEEFVSKFEIPRELYFVLQGTVHVIDDENRVKRAIRHDVPDMAPICGEEAFFLGLNHVSSLRAKADEDVKLLVLDREDSDVLSNTYPEEYELIYQNLLYAQGLDADGEELPGQEVADKDSDKAVLKESILRSFRRRAQERFASLIFAANNGEVDTVLMLARQGVNVDQVDHDGRSILHGACSSGNYKLVESLLELGADKNIKDRWGSTPLAEAIAHKQSLIVGLLCQHKALLDAHDPAGALCQAASVGDVESCRRLVENQVDPTIGDYDFRTPLHIAAAEGQLKVAEYLLARGANPNPKDRWQGTPLQDAVRGGHLALAALLRSKGGELPHDMGAEQVCEAAASGDVRKLRLLHECGGSVEEGDYDSRYPLHLAAAEGRVLAVSYLLGLSANPNVEDRWGGTPLDDAIEGGTLYHLFCAKLIAGWGGQAGRTTMTSEHLQKLEEISIEDVRALIKKLISCGYDTASSKRLSKQDLRVAMDASVRHVSVVSELFEGVDGIKQALAHHVETCQSILSSLKQSVLGIATALDSKKGARVQRRRSIEKLKPMALEAPAGPSVVVQTLRVLDKLDAEEGLEGVEELLGNHDGVDSDEEAALYSEIDMMAEAQERQMEAGVSAEKLASKQFQKVAMKIVEVGHMFKSLCSVAESAVADGVEVTGLLEEEPWLSGEDLWVMLELLRVDNVQPTEPDDIIEEAHAFHQVHARSKAPPAGKGAHARAMLTRDASRREVESRASVDSTRRRMVEMHNRSFRSLRPKSMSQQVAQNLLARTASEKSAGSESEAIRLPLSSILAGSARFRRMLAGLNIDHDLCELLRSKLAGHLSESEMRRLLPVSLAKHFQDDTVLDTSARPASCLFVLVRGECSISFLNPDVKGVSDNIREGDFFGAHAALNPGKSAEHFVVRALTPCELLQIPLEAVLSVVSADARRHESLAVFMAESPHHGATVVSAAVFAVLNPGRSSPLPPPRLDAAPAPSPSSPRIAPISECASPREKHVMVVGELERRSMREFVLEMDQLWAHFSVGSNSVFRKQLFLIAKLLGEASSELFRTMFLAHQMPVSVSVEVFWRCCVDFLADELFSDGQGNVSALEAFESAPDGEDEAAAFNPNGQDELEDDSLEEEEEEGGLLHWVHMIVEGSHHLRHRFFEVEVLDLYKDAWLDVVRDAKNPMPADKIALLLGRVFIDFGHPITKRHVQEFLMDLGKDKDTKMLHWHDVHKVLCDHRLGIYHVIHGPMIGNALNPTWHVLHKWRVLVRLCAIWYLVMVPLRIAFLPFESMLDIGALCSDLVVDALVMLDLLVRLNTAHRTHRNTWTTRRLKILRKIHLAAIMAALPLDWFGYLCGASNELSCWLRLPKVLLMLACGNKRTQQSAQFEKLEAMLQLAVLLVHCCACLWWYLGRAYSSWYPASYISWSQRHPSVEELTFDRAEIFGLDDGDSVWDRYLISVYWVTATLTVNGLVGPVLPQNLLEMFFTVVMCTLNLTVVRAVLGEVSSMIMSADKEIVSARERLELVDAFILGNELPRDLQGEIRTHFQTADNGDALEQGDVLPMLSRSLQLQVASFTCREHLEGVELLKGVSDLLKDSIAVLLRENAFAPTQWLFFESEAPSEMYFLISGTVEECATTTGEPQIENVQRAHATVGELAFYFGVRHYFSARAGKGGASCLGLERSKFISLMKLFPEENEVVAQNALRIMDKLNAHRAASSKNSKASRARSTRSARSGRSANRSVADDGDDKDARSVSSGRSRLSAVHSDLMEQMSSGNGGKDKISTLKSKRKMEGMLAFLRECAAGDLTAVQKALESDVTVNDVDLAKRSALHVAASEGHDELVRFLLEAQADVTLKDAKGNTALNDAVRHHRDSTCQVLREWAPDFALALPGKAAAVDLCQAAYDGDLDHLRRLLANGVPVDDADYDSRTALHLAACEGHVEVVKFLLDNNASVGGADRFGGTPMEDAVRHRQLEVQELLRERGARLEMSGKDYSGRLCDAAAKGDLETIQVLAKNGVDLLADDYDGRTALHLAAASEKVAVLEFLLNYQPSINVNPLDRFGDTPLGDAMRHSRPTATSMLRQAGALQKGDQELEEGSRNDAGSDERKKMLREPAVQALMENSMERHALRWVRDKLQPSLSDKTQGMLEAVQHLSTALQELKDHIGSTDPINPLSIHTPAAAAVQLEGGDRSGERLLANLRNQVWLRAHGRHMRLKERAEEVLELAQDVKRRVLDCMSVVGGEEVDAPIDCRVWTMASRRYAEEAAGWQQSLRVVSGLCGLARKLMKEIVRAENRKARAALDNQPRTP